MRLPMASVTFGPTVSVWAPAAVGLAKVMRYVWFIRWPTPVIGTAPAGPVRLTSPVLKLASSKWLPKLTST